MPGFRAGHAPGNKGLRYPADPPKVEEVIAVMRTAGGAATAGDYVDGSRSCGVPGCASRRRSPLPRPISTPSRWPANASRSSSSSANSDSNLGITSVYLQGIDSGEIIETVHARRAPIDHTWVWRADHGVEGFSGDTERWNTNTGRNGVVVNGDHVTATGP